MFLEISQNLQENAFYLVGGSYVILKTYGMKERVSSKGLWERFLQTFTNYKILRRKASISAPPPFLFNYELQLSYGSSVPRKTGS